MDGEQGAASPAGDPVRAPGAQQRRPAGPDGRGDPVEVGSLVRAGLAALSGATVLFGLVPRAAARAGGR